MADKNLHDIKIDELDNKKKTPLKNILTLLALLFIILVISVVITKLILNTGDDVDAIDGNYSSAVAETEEARDGGSNVAAGAAALAAGAAGTIAATANSATEGAKNTLNSATQNAKNAVSNTAEGLKNTASATAESVKNTANATADSVKNTANATAENAKNTANATADSAKNAIKDPNINNALKDKHVSGSKTKVTLRDHQPVKTVKELKHTSSTKNSPSHSASRNSSHTTKNVVKRSSSSKHSVGKTVGKLSRGFYIKVGTYKNTKTAIAKIKKTGLDYRLVKTKNGLTRVYIGRFSNKRGALSNLRKAKNVSSSAYIYEVK